MSTPLGSSQFFFNPALETGQSLRFDDDDSPYLTWTPASAGNRKTWTWSGWVKRGNLSSYQHIFNAGNPSPSYDALRFSNTDELEFFNGASTSSYFKTNAKYRDVGAWYHIVVAQDTTQATSTDRIKIYVNGEQVTSFSSSTYPAQNSDFFINSNVLHKLANISVSGYSYPYDGYLANVCFIDGTALDPTSFGEYKTGTTLWKPKSDTAIQSLTFGTNGFFLNFSDSADIGADTSGNGNDWTPTNLASTDVVLDGPYTGGNFCVVSPLTKSSGGALQEGNLLIPFGGTYPSTVMGSMGVSSGKWYWEIRFTGGAYTNGHAAGIATPEMANRNIDPYATTNPYNHYYDSRGYFYNSGTNTSASTFAPNDILGFALDIDNDQISYYKNGTLVGSAQSIETGQTWMPFHKNSSFTSLVQRANFGQDSSFNGTVTPQGNTDDNGLGDFYYAPPSGFLSLNTANMPEPSITAPDEYFDTLTWSKTGADNSNITLTGLSFQPDLIWAKGRSNAMSHQIADAVRGTGKSLSSDSTNGDSTNDADGYVSSFNSDGFTASAGSVDNFYFNYLNGYTYVAWNWLAGGTAVSNTDGSITSQVSANPTAGFSIVSWTQGTAGTDTVGHGLGVKPAMVIHKRRSSSSSWSVWHKDMDANPDNYYMTLDSTASKAGSTGWESPTTTTLTPYIGSSGETWITYCFAEVEGFSAIGSYTGNGSTDGPMVFTGMRPAWVMIKSSSVSTTQWMIWDNKRDTYNLSTNALRPNTSAVETTGFDIDILSNGFKVRDTGTETSLNQSSGTYIYIAFSEAALKYANAR